MVGRRGIIKWPDFMPDNIFLENYVRSVEYECTEQNEQIASALPKYNG
jgi:hypothetical protein